MSSIAVNAITDASAGNTATINAVTPNVNNVLGKNRIINGNMVIDQRNAGAAVTINSTSNTYTLDRWAAYWSANRWCIYSRADHRGSCGLCKLCKEYCDNCRCVYWCYSGIFNAFKELKGSISQIWILGSASAKSVTLSFWVQGQVLQARLAGLWETTICK
jgi:hypothetical protein